MKDSPSHPALDRMVHAAAEHHRARRRRLFRFRLMTLFVVLTVAAIASAFIAANGSSIRDRFENQMETTLATAPEEKLDRILLPICILFTIPICIAVTGLVYRLGSTFGFIAMCILTLGGLAACVFALCMHVEPFGDTAIKNATVDQILSVALPTAGIALPISALVGWSVSST